MICKKCGKTIEDDSVFCSNCGEKVIVKRCEKCGGLISENSNFCLHCRNSIKNQCKDETKEQSEIENLNETNTSCEIKTSPFFSSIEATSKETAEIQTEEAQIDETKIIEKPVETQSAETEFSWAYEKQGSHGIGITVANSIKIEENSVKISEKWWTTILKGKGAASNEKDVLINDISDIKVKGKTSIIFDASIILCIIFAAFVCLYPEIGILEKLILPAITMVYSYRWKFYFYYQQMTILLNNGKKIRLKCANNDKTLLLKVQEEIMKRKRA